MEPETLANRPPDLVASDRAARHLNAHGHPQPCVLAAVGNVMDPEECVARAAAGLACLRKIPGGAELLGGLESETDRGAVAYQRCAPTARRLRPLARRRFRTWRPFLVAMRARNPWVRFRLILLGW
jgi:hypothetical protein